MLTAEATSEGHAAGACVMHKRASGARSRALVLSGSTLTACSAVAVQAVMAV